MHWWWRSPGAPRPSAAGSNHRVDFFSPDSEWMITRQEPLSVPVRDSFTSTSITSGWSQGHCLLPLLGFWQTRWRVHVVCKLVSFASFWVWKLHSFRAAHFWNWLTFSSLAGRFLSILMVKRSKFKTRFLKYEALFTGLFQTRWKELSKP